MTKVKAIFFALVMICGTLAGCTHNTSPPDTDGDGVEDSIDLCPGTPANENVDADGCGQSQLDDDNDLVMNDIDICPNTPAGATVDAVGCSSSQLDDDGDEIMNDADLCPNTPAGELVDVDGCADNQLDTDGDGVTNDIDACPNTPQGAEVDKEGCALDSDGDGVIDLFDLCSGTPPGEVVDSNGCLTDGMIIELNSNGTGNTSRLFGVIGEDLYFWGYHDDYGQELWATDGTEAGTRLVKDFSSDQSNTPMVHLGMLGNEDYLIIRPGHSGVGTELWKTDGTTSGTVLLSSMGDYGALRFPTAIGNGKIFSRDSSGGILYALDSSGLTTISTDLRINCVGPGTDDFVYLVAEDTNNNDGYELWRSDGTTTGTYMIKDIDPNGNGVMSCKGKVIDDYLYFKTTSNEIWRSDGTGTGTVAMSDVDQNYNYVTTEEIHVLGDSLFWVTIVENSGSYDALLSKYDPSLELGNLVSTIIQGSTSSPDFFDYFGVPTNDGEAYFCIDGIFFVTDLSNVASTQPITNGPCESERSYDIIFGENKIYYKIDYDLFSYELSTGTTALVMDYVETTAGNSVSSAMIKLGDYIITGMDDGVNGIELHRFYAE